MLRHAPVTTACLGIVVISSTALSQALLATLLPKDATGVASLASWVIRIPLTVFPMLPAAPSGWAFVCLLVFLFHLRHLERQWGSARYLTFVAVVSLIGRIAAQLVVGGVTASATACRLGYCLAAILPIAALATRYAMDVPSLGRTQLLHNVVLTEKIFILASAGVFIFLSADPPKQLLVVSAEGGNNRHARIVDVVGLTSRVLQCCGGVLVGLLTRRAAAASAKRRGQRGAASSSVAGRILDTLSRNFSAPIVERVLNPLLSPVCGPVTVVEQCLPERLRAPAAGRNLGGGGVRAAGGGRGVGNLMGDGDDNIPQDVWDRIVREQQQLNAARSPTSPGYNDHRQFPTATAATQQAPPRQHVDPELVALIRELQLGASDDLIVEALLVCNGDVDAAVTYLCQDHQ